jgi:uncharacterized membrane protein (DUF2068 family)
LRLLHPGVAARVQQWALQLPLASAQRAIGRLAHLPFLKIEELSAAAFVYAAVFLVEGTGLWLGKVWAEWFTIVVTTSFIPFEIYEVLKKPGAIKIATLVINIAIVIYLVLRRKGMLRHR